MRPPFKQTLGSVTMYRQILYLLIGLVLLASILGLTRIISFGGGAILGSAVVLCATCYSVNTLLAYLFGATTNAESSLISALILTLVLTPASTLTEALILVLAGSLAMAGKYYVAYHARHIINPVVFALVLLGFFGTSGATWWIATPVLIIPTALATLLIGWRQRQVTMIVVFMIVAATTITLTGLSHDSLAPSSLLQLVTSWPIIFFAGFMLTEPSTQPPTKRTRLIYAVLVGLVFGSGIHIGALSSTPEVALLIGNIFAFLFVVRRRTWLRLVERHQLSPTLLELTFKPDAPLSFKAGQYLEWTLPGGAGDSRGNRRTFTVASSPTEPLIHLGVRIEQGRRSYFKDRLSRLEAGAPVSVSGIAGDFILPKDRTRKLVWLAGGIGITPFRAMAQELADLDEHRDIALIYQVARSQDMAYREHFDGLAAQTGISPHYLTSVSEAARGEASEQHAFGGLNEQNLREMIPDYTERLFYLSGPTGLIVHLRRVLRSAGVRRSMIKTDDFSGF